MYLPMEKTFRERILLAVDLQLFQRLTDLPENENNKN